MVSMFFCFISAMPEVAVSRVNLARACTYASLSSCERQNNNNALCQRAARSVIQYGTSPTKQIAVPEWRRCTRS